MTSLIRMAGGALCLLFFSLAPAAPGPETKVPLLGDPQLDFSRGICYSRARVTPVYLSTQGKLGYAFDLGVSASIKERFYAGLGFRYTQLEFSVAESLVNATVGGYSTTATETRNYLWMPLKAGFKPEFGRWAPYAFVEAAPGTFLAGHSFAQKKVQAVFPGEAAFTYQETYDKNISTPGRRFQMTLGGGAGLEFSYGYGIIYLQGSGLYFLTGRETQAETDVPLHTISRLEAFSLTLGIKFYL